MRWVLTVADTSEGVLIGVTILNALIVDEDVARRTGV